MSNKFLVNSQSSARQFQELIPELFDKEKYVTFTWTSGPMRSLPQLALAHIWLRTVVARLLKKDEKEVDDDEIESLKRTLKATYYHETANEWMITTLRELLPPHRERKEYSSMGKWSHAQMYEFLTWFQAWAAMRGIVLESKGQFAEIKKSENS